MLSLKFSLTKDEIIAMKLLKYLLQCTSVINLILIESMSTCHCASVGVTELLANTGRMLGIML